MSTTKQQTQRDVQDLNPAVFKPSWLVLDDTNVQVIAAVLVATSLLSVILLQSYAKFVLPLAIVGITSLRLFLPQTKIPSGLVLITGASSGIGAELTYIFAAKGHDLLLVARSQEQLEAVKSNVQDKYKRQAHTYTADLSLPGSAKKLYDQITGDGHVVSVLVNDAGLGAAGDTMSMPIEVAEQMITLNCVSLVQLTQLFGNDMIKRRRGWILQVSSVLGWVSSPGQNIYHATKHFVRSFSEALCLELRAHPEIVLTQLMPGPVRTQFLTRAHAEETFIFAASGTVEEPRDVALAGYNGLCKRKREVYSSWTSAFTAYSLCLLPRSVHLSIAAMTNLPLRGLLRAKEPTHDQKTRGPI